MKAAARHGIPYEAKSEKRIGKASKINGTIVAGGRNNQKMIIMARIKRPYIFA